ncbi:MAG: transposase [Pseudomonadota bacterium]
MFGSNRIDMTAPYTVMPPHENPAWGNGSGMAYSAVSLANRTNVEAQCERVVAAITQHFAGPYYYGGTDVILATANTLDNEITSALSDSFPPGSVNQHPEQGDKRLRDYAIATAMHLLETFNQQQPDGRALTERDAHTLILRTIGAVFKMYRDAYSPEWQDACYASFYETLQANIAAQSAAGNNLVAAIAEPFRALKAQATPWKTAAARALRVPLGALGYSAQSAGKKSPEIWLAEKTAAINRLAASVYGCRTQATEHSVADFESQLKAFFAPQAASAQGFDHPGLPSACITEALAYSPTAVQYLHELLRAVPTPAQRSMILREVIAKQHGVRLDLLLAPDAVTALFKQKNRNGYELEKVRGLSLAIFELLDPELQLEMLDPNRLAELRTEKPLADKNQQLGYRTVSSKEIYDRMGCWNHSAYYQEAVAAMPLAAQARLSASMQAFEAQKSEDRFRVFNQKTVATLTAYAAQHATELETACDELVQYFSGTAGTLPAEQQSNAETSSKGGMSTSAEKNLAPQALTSRIAKLQQRLLTQSTAQRVAALQPVVKAALASGIPSNIDALVSLISRVHREPAWNLEVYVALTDREELFALCPPNTLQTAFAVAKTPEQGAALLKSLAVLFNKIPNSSNSLRDELVASLGEGLNAELQQSLAELKIMTQSGAERPIFTDLWGRTSMKETLTVLEQQHPTIFVNLQQALADKKEDLMGNLSLTIKAIDRALTTAAVGAVATQADNPEPVRLKQLRASLSSVLQPYEERQIKTESSRFSEREIIAILEQAQTGTSIDDLCRTNGISRATYDEWHSRQGGMNPRLRQRLQALESEKHRLEEVIADAQRKAEALKAKELQESLAYAF